MISGLRSAPGRLGALYPRLRQTQVGIGSYEGVSGSPSAPGAAEQTLLGVVQVVAPTGPYTRWAERVAGGGFSEQPASNRLLYILNDQQLVAAEKMIGEPAAYIAVLTQRPGATSAIEEAFADGRYAWKKTEALYRQDDPNRVPKMYFLHWAELRPVSEWPGRTAAEHSAAQRLGGVLVFPVVVPTSEGDREPPQASFETAFQAQFPDGGAFLPKVVDGPELATNVRAIASQEAAKGVLLALGIIGCGIVATWCGYRFMRQGARA